MSDTSDMGALPADPPEGAVAPGPAPIPHGLERALLAAIVESSDDAIASKDLDGIVTSWNHAAERLFGYAAHEMLGRRIAVLAAPGREDEMPMILDRIRRGERVDHYDTVRRRKDGSLVQISLTVSPIRDEGGRIIGASKIARDIAERRRLEQEREQRVSELRHRVKNLLAIVGAIARQTTVEGHSAREYRDDLMGRLAALGAAHEAAFEQTADVELAPLITRLLEPYIHAAWGRVIDVEPGSPASLPRVRIQPLAFVLHELATNAVKHGALSQPEGRLRLAWSVDGAEGERCLHLLWQESGGPATLPPATQGFGMKLIAFTGADLGGGVKLDFRPQGLEARITVRIG